MKAGILFAGQGAQYAGMGKSLYDVSPAARGIFERAGDEITRWCFEGSHEDLKQTHITQPSVFTVTMAAFAALLEGLEEAGLTAFLPGGAGAPEDAWAPGSAGKPGRGGAPEDDWAPGSAGRPGRAGAREDDWASGSVGKPGRAGVREDDWAPGRAGAPEFAGLRDGALKAACFAGFSMGEYAALAAAGCIRDFETALMLVRKRGAYMTEAGTDAEGRPKGGMIALFGKRQAALDCIDAAREDGILEAVNFNSPLQIVAAGDGAALARLRKAAKERDGIKALPLSVSTAFHSAMMAPAAEKLAATLKAVDFAASKIPVYSNLTGRSLMEGRPPEVPEADWIRGRLALQAQKPVLWQETIENMIEAGVEFFIELGPGKTLSGLVQKTRPDFGVTVNVEDAGSLKDCVAEIRKFA